MKANIGLIENRRDGREPGAQHGKQRLHGCRI